jgi:hypothetical protein
MQRRYRGHDGRWWTVEAVSPATSGRLRDRRMAAGWLSYTSDCGESVCVAPIPAGWSGYDAEHLEALRAAGRSAGYSDAEH